MPSAISNSSNRWIHDYLLLALRLGKRMEAAQYGSPLDYFGPPDYQEQVKQEPIRAPEQLITDIQRLQADLPQQNYEPHRTRFLARHLRAFETVCRRLRGEHLSLQEEVLGCFDLHVEWLPEDLFEQAYEWYDQALPGQGDIAGRLRQWEAEMTLPHGQSHLLTQFLQQALEYARQRTHAILPLPADEQVRIAPVFDRPVWGLAAYEGNHRSQILINPQVPFPLPNLFYVLCHEGYPGHLTESILKEEMLVRQRGYLEQQAQFLLTPSFVICEGLALLAHEMLFAPGEQEQWLAEYIYPEAGITSESCNLTGIFRARDLLRGVSCNAAFLLRGGRPDQEVLDYLMRYALLDEGRARSELASLKRPSYEAYTFTYFHGRRLLEKRLAGEDRLANLFWFLTNQVLPSDLT